MAFLAGADPSKTEIPKRHIVEGRVEGVGPGEAVAVVFIFDAGTGLPYSSVSDTPFRDMQFNNEGPPVAREVIGGDGRFYIRGVFPGSYRVIAQSWEGVDHAKAPLFDFQTKRVTLRGVSEPFRVTEDEKPQFVAVKPAGSASLNVSADGASFVLVSAKPPSADLILGPLALQGAFAQNLLGFAQLQNGRITIDGLPEGELHLFGMNNDRRLRQGVTTVNAKAGQSVECAIELRRYDDPADPPPVPEKLRPLVERMPTERKAISAAVEAALGEDVKSIKTEMDFFPFLDREIPLADGQRIALRDFVAAEMYFKIHRRAKEHADEKVKPADAKGQ